MAVPAWQTDDLEEEWVDSSPSPPPSLKAVPAKSAQTESLPRHDPASIRAKRGSLRALGHSAARSLPSRAASSPQAGSPRVVSGHGEGRVLSEKVENNTAIGHKVLSPPTSDAEKDGGAGTFVVKDGVDDDRGKHLARKGKDMFGPSALEKMFRPPSPVIEGTPAVAPTTPAPASTSPPPSSHIDSIRRASNPYAPTNPSRLSKSVTPSNISSSFSVTLPHEGDSQNTTILHDEEDASSLIVDVERDTDHTRELKSGEIETDMSLPRPGQNYPFTFSHPVADNAKEVSPNPSLSPFDPETKSQSTIHNHSPPKPGLRLFRSAYDTYTREHLSALVDSIAIDASPSPPPFGATSARYHGSRVESSSGSSEQSGSIRSGSRQSYSDESRSSKRMRMSPSSPGRRHNGVRDWAAEGRVMMDRLRAAAESTTTGSVSRSDESRSQEYEQSSSQSPERYPTPPPLTQQNLEPFKPAHRSNPSTTSSTYLKRAEEMMAAIRARAASDSLSTSEFTGTETGSSRAPSNDWDIEAIARRAREENGLKGTGRAEFSEISSEARPGAAAESKQRLDNRRPTSAASSGDEQGVPVRPDQEDFNRFVSATTVATATTMSTSFVKHPGPRQGANNIRNIRPDEVQGIVPDRVGRMRYDKGLMRWVKDRAPLSGIDEAGEGSATGSGSGGRTSRGSRSQSGESEDVFAGIDSWGHESNQNVTVPQGGQEEESDDDEDDENVIRQADTTRIFDDTESDSSQSEGASENEMVTALTHAPPAETPNFTSPPTRPVVHHASSAPAIMTPQANLAVRPIRSALRNARGNSLTPGVRKQTQWHESITPAPDSAARRSVSFSDGKKSGKMRDCHPDETIETVDSEHTDHAGKRTDEAKGGDEEWFRAGEGSWMPSIRTQRIEGMMEDMNGLSLDEGTPSKPPRPIADSLIASPEQMLEGATSEEADRTIRGDTVRPRHSRSSRSRHNDANATFLTECSFGVTHDKLVQLITDVYGSEPYWDHLTLLDLRGKGVDSVTRLKEFLPELTEVYLNDNKISYLSGIPNSITRLHVPRNRLTAMSSVDHLKNLTYLDISHNNLDSVSQLSCLTQLVELNLDNNLIKDLTGISGLRRLAKLSASNNKISKLNCSSTSWLSLESLNLSGNRLLQVESLGRLTKLKDLNLDSNRIEDLYYATPITSLRTLRISDNDLTSVDISLFPKLRTLYADRNAIIGLEARFGTQNRLENLSLRNQSVPGLSLDWSILTSLKRLYISGNPLSDDSFPLRPMASMSYLEAAACSLSSWPKDVGTSMPHLEILNLNYNYLQNLDGLAGLRSLRKVSVVGARLGGEGGKGVMRGLKDLAALEEVDLRMNPSTLGFYLPLMLPSTTSDLEPDTLNEPRVAQNPLPNVTLATIRPPDTPGPKRLNQLVKPSQPSTADWTKLDAQFRKSLPDEWYSKRLVYRGLIMGQLPRLRMLDGVVVEEAERRKAEMLLDLAKDAI